MNTKFTKGPWIICDGDSTDSSDLITTNYRSVENNIVPIAEIETEFDGIIGTEQEANAHLIAAAPDMYEMAESLSHELNMAIDEINTMRDIHNKDNLTPADHWDKESLHEAQLTLAKARGEIT